MDLLDQLRSALASETGRALSTAIALAARGGRSLFLVGGAVRDLLLGRPSSDLDLVTEAEVRPLAEAIAGALGARGVFHDRFGTAAVRAPRLKLDLARSRREAYQRPGALPTVAPSSIVEDLARRDFSINAIALRLTEPAGQLVDPFHGEHDLREGSLRVLHDRSFQDDATRMVRALRYAARLGFHLESRTRELLVRDLGYLDTISGPRLRRELSLALQEQRCVEAFEHAARLGVLAAIHPRLRLEPFRPQAWREALSGPRYGDRDLLGWCLIAECGSESEVEDLDRRLHLTARVAAALRDLVRLAGLSDKLVAPETGPADAAELLDRLVPEAIWAAAVRGAPAASIFAAYLSRWRRARPVLTGDDLVAAGVPPGPVIGAALRSLRRARVEGAVHTREEELSLLRREMGLKL